MGLKSNILPIVDALKTNKTLQIVNLSANQLTKLDEEYVLEAFDIQSHPNMQQMLLDNDKYFSKAWN